MATLPSPSDDLLERYDVPAPRYTSYPPATRWSPEVTAEAFAEVLRTAARRTDEPLALYVHLPFCRSLCWYCGCNVVIAKKGDRTERYLDALVSEVARVASLLGPRRRLSQIHWGGGTPTQLDEAQLTRLWNALTEHFELTEGAEVAIELHPAITTLSQLQLLRRLGFNRVSMGLQDFDPEVQEATNRIQTVEQTQACVDEARRLGFQGVNLDLIYGLPLQTEERWRNTLGEVVRLRPDRIAVYSFAFVPNLLKHQRRLPTDRLPLGRDKLDLFRTAFAVFTDAGYVPVGMDHFALPGDSLLEDGGARLSRNFQGYTTATTRDLVGLGASAISAVGSTYAQNARGVEEYGRAIASGGLATVRGIHLTSDDLARRELITRLMCQLTVDRATAEPLLSADRIRAVEALEHEGLVRRTADRLAVTELGRLFLRNVAMVFDPQSELVQGPHARGV